MSKLEKLVEEHKEPYWTEDEMVEWIKRLPPAKKQIFMNTLKEAKAQNFDLHSFSCKARAKAEEIDARTPQRTIIDVISEVTIGWAIGGMISEQRFRN